MRKRNYIRQVGVLFDDDTYSKLVQITDREEISLSEYVRAVVEEKLENIEMEGPSGQKLLLMPKKSCHFNMHFI